MFDIVRNERFNLKLDNVTLVLNAVDVLAGDESYLELRRRRQRYRTLVRVQEEAEGYRKEAQEAVAAAEKQAKEELEKRQKEFEARQKAIDEDQGLTQREREIRKQIALEDEQRRLDVVKENIERRKQSQIDELKKKEQRNILSLEHKFKAAAIFLSPIPAVLLGLIVLISRLLSESQLVDPKRRV